MDGRQTLLQRLFILAPVVLGIGFSLYLFDPFKGGAVIVGGGLAILWGVINYFLLGDDKKVQLEQLNARLASGLGAGLLVFSVIVTIGSQSFSWHFISAGAIGCIVLYSGWRRM